MKHGESITPIVKVNLKFKCWGQVYVIKVMHIYLLKELYQSQNKQKITQIITMKKWYIRIVLHLLTAKLITCKINNKSTKTIFRMINWLIDPSFQAVNRLFVLSFENATDRTVRTKYSLSIVEIKDYNRIIDRLNFFDQLAKKN